jgi:two-component system, chemotaxis family, CheB/CheR fusion protein
MRSLAEEQGHRAIGVVLSGTGSDGTLGISEIKAAGGITFAQDSTAEHDNMPRNAIATGAVDFVLAPEEIGRELVSIARHPLARGDGQAAIDESALVRILDVLREMKGVDFSNYKRGTLQRRIARRVILHKLDGLETYVRLLQANAAEVDALYRDVLISVTSFFRNPEAYDALKAEIFPRLTEGRGRLDPVRIWALGCATGEEAYSLAMLYSEYCEESGRRVPLQVFATDLNGAGIEKARTGMYAKGIVQDVAPERLRRFFVEVDGHYRIAKPIRDMCVFARQDVLADPPFSRLDVIACRNMLIYLQPPLQQRLIPVLHYALRGEGVLWLGSSETIGAHRDLFELVDPRHKIYKKKGGKRDMDGALLLPRWRPTASRDERPGEAPARLPVTGDPHREADRLLLTRFAPPSVVVNDDLEIVQFRGDTSPFLTPAQGRASLNLLKMVREGLLVAVRGAAHRALRERLPAKEAALRVKDHEGWREVDILVMPLKEGGLLITFEEPSKHVAARAREMDAQARASQKSADKALASRGSDETAEREVARLQQELSAMRDYLQAMTEQHQASQEELQAANEEVQSANEELQSINEELETSKEELQSSNEELATVNDELQNRNSELSRLNNDLSNLLAGVQMAVVMVDMDLRIRRFTGLAEKLLRLGAADLGRSIADLKLNMQVPELPSMVAEVIREVVSVEADVQDSTGRWYSLGVRPYRSADNRIEGAVLAFVDVDTHKRAELAIRESEARFELLAGSAPVPIWMSDPQGVRYVNPAFERFVGETEEMIRGTDIGRFLHPDDREGYTGAFTRAVAARSDFHARCRFRRTDNSYRWMQVVGSPRMLADGTFMGYVGSIVDVTEMKEAEEALRELDRGKNEFLAMLAHELRNPLAGIRNATRLLASHDAEAVEQAVTIIDRQGAHMARMVDELLDVARINSGRIQLRVEEVELLSVLRQSIELTAAERSLADQHLALHADCPQAWVSGDAMRLGQVFSNLLNNASKFSRRGGHIEVRVEMQTGAGAAPAVVVHIRDDGIGIEPRMLARIFELFVQAERPVDPARGGIGLGLTLARRLLELHGGSIEASSAGTGQGSVFSVRLPTIEPARGVPREAARKREVARPAVVKKLLIVDDNPDSAESMRLMYRLSGHEARVVGEGAAAVEAAAEMGADAVLLDIGLPDMDGYEVARRLRADPRTREILIIAITGYGREEDLRQSREAGIDEHVVKPVDPDRVMERLLQGRGVRNSLPPPQSDAFNSKDDTW